MTTRTIDLIKAADTHANRPTATTVPAGCLYACTTHSLIYRSDGSSWSTWATLAGGSAVLLSTVTAAGDLIVASGSGAVTNLAKGSALQVLRVNAAGTALEYAAPTGSSLVSPDDVPASPDAWDYEFNGTTTTIPTGYGWVNQGAAAWNEEKGAGTLLAPSNGASVNMRIIDKAIPTGTSWTVVGKFTLMGTSGIINSGLCMRNSVNGKIVTFGHRQNGSVIRALHFTNTTTFNVQITADINVMPGHTFYLRIKKNSATSYDFAYSGDGVYFWDLITGVDVAATSGTLDKLGIVCEPENSAAAGLSCHWLRKTA